MDIDNNNAAADKATAAAGEVHPGNPARFFKLTDLWTNNPAAWFGVIESQFQLRGISY